VSRIAPKPGSYPVPQPDARGDIVSHTLRRVTDSPLDRAVAEARDALVARQNADGYWLFELEADCTIPAEYIMMMHYLDEIDAGLEVKLCRYLRAAQAEHGGWPLYHGGDLNISCSVKAYYALKLAGDSPDAPHMVRARAAILQRGGAAAVNVFTRIALALFGQLPWRGVPYIPVEIMLLPSWFPFHLDKVAYWSRTVMVPLFILCTRKPLAKNPRDVHIRELFTTPPEKERDYFRRKGFVAKMFLAADRLGRMIDPLIPARVRERATRKAETWMLERLNGEDGLGAIFPAMVNALEVMVLLGYTADDPRRVTAKRALQKLLVVGPSSAYCQPCVSPIWDTALATLAMQEAGDTTSSDASIRALDWLQTRQLLDEPGDWRVNRPGLAGGGWAFQFANGHYPDLDDTAVVVWAMHQARDSGRYDESVRRALDWLVGMQSSNGGFAAFDADNTSYYLNMIPFADHGALLDPPTSDVTARVVTVLARVGRPQDKPALERAIAYLREEQEADGSWFGRWGTNYIYGTWSVLTAFAQAHIGVDDPAVRRAVEWLTLKQNPDGGWGESNDTYAHAASEPVHGASELVHGASEPAHAAGGRGKFPSTAYQSAWALLGLLAAGEARSDAARRGAEFLMRTQQADGLWSDPSFTAPGFPRVFYLRYHGYSAYFPFWALAAYRTLTRRGIAH
jgi:squalene-hopene/tetraprenyl-beta-curcumene cyclase